MSKIKNVG